MAPGHCIGLIFKGHRDTMWARLRGEAVSGNFRVSCSTPLDNHCLRPAPSALALVVIYTNRSAFFSPIALVVVAAIGLAALLLQSASAASCRKFILPSGSKPLACSAPCFALSADYLRMSSAPWN